MVKSHSTHRQSSADSLPGHMEQLPQMQFSDPKTNPTRTHTHTHKINETHGIKSVHRLKN